MDFCPKCGSILMMKKTQFGCPRCNYKTKKVEAVRFHEKIVHVSNNSVVKNEGKTEVLPITDYKCKKCKNGKAYFWVHQSADGDDTESEFYKCTKCGNTVREKEI